MDLKPGTRVKYYTLERQLGRGASGEVWKAYDETKTVAIKFMNENLMTSASAEKHRARLIREVEALRRLQHPNIPTLYDYDLDFTRPYIAMRFVGGDSYDRLIANGEMLKIPLERRLEMIRDLAFALTAAHEINIIHRDIKPANLTGIENPYLLDFSISLETEDMEHTQRFVGTTLYMSADGIADRISDNYSFAVVVYEILFGRHPIYQPGDSIFNQFIAALRIQNRQWYFPSTVPPSQLPADLRTADLRKLDVIFERAIGPREQRYLDLREFVRDIRGAILPHESAVEEARIANPPPRPPQYNSQPPVPPIPRHISHPPAFAEPAPEPEPPQPQAETPAAKDEFLDKAFVDLPAIKLPDPEPEAKPPAPEPKPQVKLEQTQIEHSTVPYDYEAKQRKPVVDELEQTNPQINVSAALPPAYVPTPAPNPPVIGPEDRTMMEFRIPSPPPAPEPEPPAPAPAPMIGAEDRTMMEIPLRPPTPPAPEKEASAGLEVEQHPASVLHPPPRSAIPLPDIDIPMPAARQTPPPQLDVTMPEVPIARQSPPPPSAGEMTLPDIPISRPTPPSQGEATMPDIPIARQQQRAQTGYPPPPRPQQPPQGNFTQLEASGNQSGSSDDQFTMMEMQPPSAQGAWQPTAEDGFTMLEMQTPQASGKTPQAPRKASRSNPYQLMMIVVVIIIVLIVLAIIVVLATSGTSVG